MLWEVELVVVLWLHTKTKMKLNNKKENKHSSLHVIIFNYTASSSFNVICNKAAQIEDSLSHNKET